MSPRSTLAVKFWSCDLRVKPKAARTATTARTPANSSHLRFFFIRSPEIIKIQAGSYSAKFSITSRSELTQLLVAQRLNGIEQRSLARGVVTEKNSHRNGKHGSHRDGLHRGFHGPL